MIVAMCHIVVLMHMLPIATHWKITCGQRENTSTSITALQCAGRTSAATETITGMKLQGLQHNKSHE